MLDTTHEIQEVFRTGTADMRFAVAMMIFGTLPEWMPWLAARQCTGLTISRGKEGWLVILKGMRKGKQEVAFAGGDTMEEALVTAAYGLAFDLLRWSPDKWGSMRSDKK